jgi:hypothetical protein
VISGFRRGVNLPNYAVWDPRRAHIWRDPFLTKIFCYYNFHSFNMAWNIHAINISYTCSCVIIKHYLFKRFRLCVINKTENVHIKVITSNHCYCGKAIRITHSECVPVAAFYPAWNAHASYYIDIWGLSNSTAQVKSSFNFHRIISHHFQKFQAVLHSATFMDKGQQRLTK